ncbi:MFS transporter [Actinomyces trachealis]|uniref:MFS transporter n=1 Tax=Actinomyces trachealis TaxID=2763540 RepID=UPI001892ADCB|nr:MFS transporter [Actinomyces trachealis]
MTSFVLSALRDPRRAVPTGMLISNVGNGMYLLAVSVILYRSSGSSAMFAWLLVYQSAAVLGMQVFASVGADRGHAQRLAVLAELCRGILVSLGALFATMGQSSALAVIGVLLSLAQPFFRTSIFKIGPLIADGEDLARYNARTSTFQQLGQFLGAGSAGVLMGCWLYLPLWINALSYLASAFFTWICTIPEQEPSVRWRTFIPQLFHPKKAISDWWDVCTYCVRSPIIFGMSFFAASDLIFINVINIAYAPMLSRLELQDTWISVWDVFFAVGAILGVNLFGRLTVIQSRWQVPVVCLLVETLLATYLLTQSAYTAAGAMLLIGTVNSISVSAFAFFLQTHTQKSMIARIAGVRQFCLTALSAMLMGWLSHGVDHSQLSGFIRTGSVLTLSAFGVVVLFIFAGRRHSPSVVQGGD